MSRRPCTPGPDGTAHQLDVLEALRPGTGDDLIACAIVDQHYPDLGMRPAVRNVCRRRSYARPALGVPSASVARRVGLSDVALSHYRTRCAERLPSPLVLVYVGSDNQLYWATPVPVSAAV